MPLFTNRAGHWKSAKLALVAAGLFALSACTSGVPKHLRPLPHAVVADMKQNGFSKTDPILLRIFKKESELEVWKKSSKNGKFRRFKTYEICRWSGELGPKRQEGDRQAPEGFYSVTPALMNPNSSYHLSFNIGFPNQFDRAHGRTGTHLMVHGACSSAGCYAMEDPQIEEIYSLAREAFDAGQKSFQVQAYPFRMTPENLAGHRENPNIGFWRMLKEGHDHFEVTRQRPRVDVCERRYVFNARTGEFDPTGPCPALDVPPDIQQAVSHKHTKDYAEEMVVLAKLEKQRLKSEPRSPSAVIAPSATVVVDAEDVPGTAATQEAAAAVGRGASIPPGPTIGFWPSRRR